MDSSLKQRLVGAVVLIALAVIFLPMLVKGPAPDSGVSDVPLDIPVEPKSDTATRDLPLTAPGATPQGGAVGMPATTAEPADATAPAPQGGLFPAFAAGDYAVSFGSYASAADADKVIAALRTAELPAWREAATVNGRAAQRVRIGPFADRAMAEAARLRATHVNDSVGAKVVVLDASTAPEVAPASTSVAAPSPAPAKTEALPPPAVAKPVAIAPAPAKPTPVVAAKAEAPPKPVAVTPPAPKPETKPADTGKTGFAVQVGAFASAADATRQRDKLRAAGFNAFTDTASTDKGTLTRVRVGPAMTRAEADQLKASLQSKLGIAGMVRPHP
ncbi:MAG: SPOR domain-containing protein [Lysobacteraceae bacterium]|nr:MAG: SPOR domain-containing protein [Xanthomonadaceae bacterium]